MAKRHDRLQDLNERLNEHLTIIRRCTAPAKRWGRLLHASPPGKRYPYVYPRDMGAATQLFRRIAGSRNGYDAGPEAFELLRSAAEFMRDVQDPEGAWGQRYTPAGEDASIYIQEDNVAHGITIICNYLLTAQRLGHEVPGLHGHLEAVNRALDHAITRLYRRELNLFESTTAIHESAIESGFTLWTNLSFLYAFSLAHEVDFKLDEPDAIDGRHLAFRKQFYYTVSELFMDGDRYVRRIDPSGHLDLRPDVTLLSPYWYGFMSYREPMRRSADHVAKQLRDPELGMVMRYLPFSGDHTIHIHAGNGPWIHYTAMLAQYFFWDGQEKRAQALLDRIDTIRDERGEIPEHISTRRRFEDFMTTEWRTGLDYEKEFDPGILLPGLPFDRILEEANNMADSYRDTAAQESLTAETNPPQRNIRFTTPLMWSHVEYARALMVRAGDWWELWKK